MMIFGVACHVLGELAMGSKVPIDSREVELLHIRGKKDQFEWEFIEKVIFYTRDLIPVLQSAKAKP